MHDMICIFFEKLIICLMKERTFKIKIIDYKKVDNQFTHTVHVNNR